jgi:hypothetical protein
MAGRCAEADAPVWVGAEVTAVEAVAVEIDEPAASRALSSPLPEIEADAAHAFNVGAVDCRGLISLDQVPSRGREAFWLAARSDLRAVRFGSDAPIGRQGAGGTVAWGGGPLLTAGITAPLMPSVGRCAEGRRGDPRRQRPALSASSTSVPFEEEESPFVGLLQVEAA